MTTHRRLQTFARKYGEDTLALAYHAALPVALTPELLHLIRLNFLPELDYLAEANLLLHLCQEIGEGLYEIESTMRAELLQGLAEKHGASRLREVAILLWQYSEQAHAWTNYERLERAQQLTVLSMFEPHEALNWLAQAETLPSASDQRAWFIAMREELTEQSSPSNLIKSLSNHIGLNLHGRIFGEKYEIRGDKPLGKGGHGEVWLAWDNSLRRFVAIKIPITQETPSPQQVDDFLRVAQTIANLRHKHILEVYDFGKDNFNGHLLPYLVMAFANKGTLAERIKSTPLSLEKTKDILKQVSQALDYIHYRKLLHLDLKPQNILFDADDNVLLADIDIFTSLTNIHSRGTWYMSPEQRSGKANGASDIYALGMVLRQMLAGGNSPIANDLPRGISPKIKEVINKATAVHPNNRYQSANELFTAFAKAIDEADDEPTEELINNLSNHIGLNLQGRILQEKYKIRGNYPLGKGGYGEVWQAWDNSFKRLVAVKILISPETPSPQQVDDFLREAQTIANLKHKHILEVYDLGTENFNGHLLPYIVMAFANNGTLAERIKSTPLSLEKTKDILKQVSEVLDYIHHRKIFHLDIKPQNILFDAEDNVHLTDFGIAKISTSEDEFTSLTNIRGTHGYMSPEQKTGKANGASDVYALGMVLRQMLAGGNSPIANDLPPEISPKIKAVINKATMVHPNDRYQSANALFTAFAKAMDESDGEPSENLSVDINTISPKSTQSVIKTVTKQAMIPPPTVKKLVTILLRCGPFSDNRSLQAYFIHQPISPWKNSLPLNNVNNAEERVQVTIAYLWTQYNQKSQNALVLFLQVLSHDKDTKDKCQHDLAELAMELEDLAIKLQRLEIINSPKSTQSVTKKPVISPSIVNKLVSILLICGPFSDNKALQAYFVHQAISPWKNSLPLNNVNNAKERVQVTIDYLWTQYNQKSQNALVLFLQVLSQDKDTKDLCQYELADLATKLQHSEITK